MQREHCTYTKRQSSARTKSARLQRFALPCSLPLLSGLDRRTLHNRGQLTNALFRTRRGGVRRNAHVPA